METISIGHENFIPREKILLILQIDSRPIRSIIKKARDKEKLIDATNGRKTRSVILTTEEYVVLSSLAPKGIAKKIEDKKNSLT